ncbi:MAG: hypothetical protein LBP61_05690, partial [Desulfovibrio sp.]|nr:hypothetical protein [Desulfovibrio sp.]
GRVHGLLLCSDQTSLLFTLRNLGPDQGFAVGRSPASSDLLVFFYHPSPEEAARRFPEIFSDIRQATRLYDQETDRAPKGGSPGGERGLARP